jgi:membrane protein
MKMSPKVAWKTIKDTFRHCAEDDVVTLAASLTFFAMLSLAPLLVLVVSAGANLGRDAHEQFVDEVGDYFGPEAASAIDKLLDQAQEKPLEGSISAITSLALVILGATAVFAHLQKSLNRVFNVRLRKGLFFGWLYKRGLSLAMVLVIGIFLVLSVAISSIAGAVLSSDNFVWRLTDFLGGMIILAVLFTLLYKIVPDITISWTDATLGGLLGAVLLSLSRYGVARYLAARGFSSVYGAASVLAVILVWVFASGLILFFAAEFAQAAAQNSSRGFKPGRFAKQDP